MNRLRRLFPAGRAGAFAAGALGAALALTAVAAVPGAIKPEDRAWWAFQPPRGAPPPPAAPGDRNEIDAFLRARLESAGLAPAPEASRGALLRRLTYDLWGLPPEAEAVEAFEADPAPDAYEKRVDALLADRRYGERWARHWLDLVRYADSDGYRIDDLRPNAWHYRDYVIRSLNQDKPYDRFVREQLAGDELYPGDPDALIATGYLRHWIYEYNNRDARTQWETILNDITDTTGDVFFGLGLQCARCHDHKFDPLLQADYYRLQSFFTALHPRDDRVAATPEQQAEHAAKLEEYDFATSEIRKVLSTLEHPHRIEAEREAVGKFPEDVQVLIRKPEAQRTPAEKPVADLAYQQVHYEWYRLEKRFKDEAKEMYLARKRDLASFDALRPPELPRPPSVSDWSAEAPELIIPKRGKEGPVAPGWPAVLGQAAPEIAPRADSTGRRAALAEWLTRDDNPFTARVMVNRLWQQHFGRGLAANASDFGKLGEQPSHPELLEWLADRFIREQYSLKALHRLMVTSAAYRRSARHPSPETGRLRDPENRLYWKFPVRRLDAEQIRDSLFAASGELKAVEGGPGRPHAEAQRSIYSTVMRNTRDPVLAAFDAPFWFSSASSRDTTTTPVQSLLLINNSFLLQRAKALAREAVAASGASETAWITAAYRRVFSRPPAPEELEAARGFLAAQAARINPEETTSDQAAFVPGKIPFRDGQAAEVRPAGPQKRFQADLADALPGGSFTVEAYIVPRSIYTNANVRTVVAHGDPPRGPGWAFGVTGQMSRRKPQTLVMHLFGRHLDGHIGEAAVFSDHHMALDKPYYIAAAVTLAGTNTPGEVAFFVKDLSNDDEPLLTARVAHTLAGGHRTGGALVLGGRGKGGGHDFDGLIDDIRLSAGALDTGQLLYNTAAPHPGVAGYWTFEAQPQVLHDASGRGHSLQPAAVGGGAAVDLRRQAFVDLCHVLLNSNEFLYTE